MENFKDILARLLNREADKEKLIKLIDSDINSDEDQKKYEAILKNTYFTDLEKIENLKELANKNKRLDSSKNLNFLKTDPQELIALRPQTQANKAVNEILHNAKANLQKLNNDEDLVRAGFRQQAAFSHAQNKTHKNYNSYLTKLKAAHHAEIKQLTEKYSNKEQREAARTKLLNQQKTEITAFTNAHNTLLKQLEFDYHSAHVNARALTIQNQEKLAELWNIDPKVAHKVSTENLIEETKYSHYKPEKLNPASNATPKRIGIAYQTLSNEFDFNNIKTSLSSKYVKEVNVSGTPDNPDIKFKVKIPEFYPDRDTFNKEFNWTHKNEFTANIIARPYIKMLCMRDPKNPGQPAVKKADLSDIAHNYGQNIANSAAIKIIEETGLNPFAEPPEITFQGINIRTDEAFNAGAQAALEKFEDRLNQRHGLAKTGTKGTDYNPNLHVNYLEPNKKALTPDVKMRALGEPKKNNYHNAVGMEEGSASNLIKSEEQSNLPKLK